MDFVYHYTQEQERFRQEVRLLLDTNPSTVSTGKAPLSDAQQATWEQIDSLKKRLGRRGWLLPGLAGDGGRMALGNSCQLVLWEELEKCGLLCVVAESGWSLAQAVAQWGDDSQIESLLPALGRGEASFSRYVLDEGMEPYGATLGIEAVEDSDDFVLDGEGVFTGLAPHPDYLWTLARIRREETTEPITASFLLPTGLSGITFAADRRLLDKQERLVTFAQARVPRSCMLGGEGDGWLLMASSLLGERALQHPHRADAALEELLRYADDTSRNGVRLSEEPVLQQLLMEAYTGSRLLRLLRTRDAWTRESGGEVTYQEAQTRLWERRNALRLAEIVREVVGLYALLDCDDPRAPAEGRFESQQRDSLALHHGTPGVDWESEIIARHLGLERSRKELPAALLPTANESVVK